MNAHQLKYGLSDAVPADAHAAWGAAWRWPDEIVWEHADIVGDSDHDRHVLFEWLTRPREECPLEGARANARALAGGWDLGAHEDRQVTLYEDDRGVIVANPKGSSQLLHVSAWLKPQPPRPPTTHDIAHGRTPPADTSAGPQADAPHAHRKGVKCSTV